MCQSSVDVVWTGTDGAVSFVGSRYLESRLQGRTSFFPAIFYLEKGSIKKSCSLRMVVGPIVFEMRLKLIVAAAGIER